MCGSESHLVAHCPKVLELAQDSSKPQRLHRVLERLLASKGGTHQNSQTPRSSGFLDRSGARTPPLSNATAPIHACACDDDTDTEGDAATISRLTNDEAGDTDDESPDF